MALDANGNLTDLSDSGYSMSDLVSFISGLADKYGVSKSDVQSDAENLARKLTGEAGYIAQLGGNPRAAFDLFDAQYRARGGSQQTGSGVDSSTRNTGAVAGTIPLSQALATQAQAAGHAVTLGVNTQGVNTSPVGLQSGPALAASVPLSGGFNVFPILILGAVAVAAWYLLRK